MVRRHKNNWHERSEQDKSKSIFYNLIISIELAEKIGLNIIAVENNISKLKEKGLLKRVGLDKGGHWDVLKNG